MGSVTVLESLQQSLLSSGAVVLLGQADADEGSTVLGCANCTADSPELRGGFAYDRKWLWASCGVAAVLTACFRALLRFCRCCRLVT